MDQIKNFEIEFDDYEDGLQEKAEAFEFELQELSHAFRDTVSTKIMIFFKKNNSHLFNKYNVEFDIKFKGEIYNSDGDYIKPFETTFIAYNEFTSKLSKKSIFVGEVVFQLNYLYNDVFAK